MNYSKIYASLVTKALSENREKFQGTYYESHHIVPRCLGGSNRSDNKVLLTFKEHYIAHILLVKMHPDSYKLKVAVFRTCHSSSESKKATLIQLEKARRIMAEGKRQRYKSEHNPFFGKKHTEETKARMKSSRAKLDLTGANNSNFGNHWTQEMKDSLSKKKKGTMTGDTNPTKRPEVREKLRASKTGAGNPNAKVWTLKRIDTGEIVTFKGGIKRFLAENGCRYEHLGTPKALWIQL